MTSKEFKEKFKVGDKIIGSMWFEPGEITAIGKGWFLVTVVDSEIAHRIGSDDWIKVGPEKKPSTVIRERMKPFKYWQGVSTEPCIDYLEDKVNSMLVFLDDNWPNVVKK